MRVRTLLQLIKLLSYNSDSSHYEERGEPTFLIDIEVGVLLYREGH